MGWLSDFFHNPLKTVTKTFKKVVNVVKKIVPVVLAAAAIYFTAGAALGIAATTGGWGSAAGVLTAKMGLTGTLGSVVSGAVTQAGWGAVIGAGLSAATGGDVMAGMQRGALTGAITGGISGGMDPNAAAFNMEPSGNQVTGHVADGGTVSADNALKVAGPAPSSAQATPGLQPMQRGLLRAPNPVAGHVMPAANQMTSATQNQAQAPWWYKPPVETPWYKTPAVIGGAMQGVGNALSGGDREAAAEIEQQAIASKRAAIAANYGATSGYPGLLSQAQGGVFDSQTFPTPGQRYRTAMQPRPVYDPKTGTYVWANPNVPTV